MSSIWEYQAKCAKDMFEHADHHAKCYLAQNDMVNYATYAAQAERARIRYEECLAKMIAESKK